jgi:hypothetical protein
MSTHRQGSLLNTYLRVAYAVLEDAGRELDNSDWNVLLLQLQIRCQHLAVQGSVAWDEFMREIGDAA